MVSGDRQADGHKFVISQLLVQLCKKITQIKKLNDYHEKIKLAGGEVIRMIT